VSTTLGDGRVDRVRGEDTVLGDYTLVTAAGLGSAVLSFLSATLTTRVLAPAAFGALSLVLVTSLILQTATSSWTSLAVARFGREAIDRDGTMAAVTRARLRIVAPWFLVATLVIAALKATGILPPQLSWPLVGVAVLHGTIAVLYEHCTNLLRSWGRQRLSALAIILQQLALVVVIGVLLIAGGHAKALEIGLLYVAGSALLLAVYLPLLRSAGFARMPRDRELERRMWRFSAPLIAYSVSAYLIGSIDLWVLSAFARPRTVGTYAAAYRAYTVLLTIAAASSPVLMTLFVSLRLAGRTSEARRFVSRVAPALVLAAGSVIALLVAPAYALVPVVFGRAFSGGALPLAILLIGVVAYLQCCLLGSVLTAHDRTADTAWIIVIAAAVNIVADVVAIGGLGAGSWAAAAATAGAGMIVAAGYERVAADSTGARVQVTVAPYIAPSLAVVVLVLAPEAWRVPASLGAAMIATSVTLALRSRAYGINRELVGRLRGLRTSGR
jgi:O-antigen/teichoic acid export membrane protein